MKMDPCLNRPFSASSHIYVVTAVDAHLRPKVLNNEDRGLKGHPVSRSSGFTLFSTLFSFILLFLLWASTSANMQRAGIWGRKLCTRPPAVQSFLFWGTANQKKRWPAPSVRHKTVFTSVDETNSNLSVTGSTKPRTRTETCHVMPKVTHCTEDLLKNWETYQPTAGFSFQLGEATCLNTNGAIMLSDQRIKVFKPYFEARLQHFLSLWQMKLSLCFSSFLFRRSVSHHLTSFWCCRDGCQVLRLSPGYQEWTSAVLSKYTDSRYLQVSSRCNQHHSSNNLHVDSCITIRETGCGKQPQ